MARFFAIIEVIGIIFTFFFVLVRIPFLTPPGFMLSRGDAKDAKEPLGIVEWRAFLNE